MVGKKQKSNKKCKTGREPTYILMYFNTKPQFLVFRLLSKRPLCNTASRKEKNVAPWLQCCVVANVAFYCHPF
jgi:hypothetical protein